jgi:hypothetical protein
MPYGSAIRRDEVAQSPRTDSPQELVGPRFADLDAPLIRNLDADGDSAVTAR